MRHVLVLSLLLLLLPNMSKAQEAEAAPEPATADAMPPAPAWLDELDALYDTSIRVPGLEDRTFSPEHWWEVALPLATQARGFQVEEVGSSAEGRPLRHVSWGGGHRAEERRGGKEWARQGSTRWPPGHEKKKMHNEN